MEQFIIWQTRRSPTVATQRVSSPYKADLHLVVPHLLLLFLFLFLQVDQRKVRPVLLSVTDVDVRAPVHVRVPLLNVPPQLLNRSIPGLVERPNADAKVQVEEIPDLAVTVLHTVAVGKGHVGLPEDYEGETGGARDAVMDTFHYRGEVLGTSKL